MSDFEEVTQIPRAFVGLWLPREVWFNPDLSLSEICLLAEINSLDKNGQGCYASNSYLATFSRGKWSEGQIANIISTLRKRGYIEDRKFDGRRRWISVNFEPLKAVLSKTLSQHSGKAESSIQEKLNIYNKDNNKDKISKVTEDSEVEKKADKVQKAENSKINFSALGDSKISHSVPKVLKDKELLKVLAEFRKLIFRNCSAKTSTVIEGIPRAVSIIEEYFPKEGVTKLIEALQIFRADDLYEWMKVNHPTSLSPKGIFSKTFVENHLLTFISEPNGRDNENPPTEEERRQIEEANQRNIDAWSKRISRGEDT